MPTHLTPDQKADVVASLQRYFHQELDCDLEDLPASFLLDYILKEIAPFAYNQGVEDAKAWLQSKTDDLTGTCFEESLTYWNSPAPGTRHVRRKPGR